MSNCPDCNSSNTKKMQMVWASGSRRSQSKSTGVGISTRGTIGLGIGRGSSQSQSHLAAACAPPKASLVPKIIIGLIALMFIPSLLSGVLSVFSEPKLMDGILNFIVCAPLLGLLLFGLMKLYKKMDEKNKQAQSDYSKTWVCLKCGKTFQ